MKRIFLIFTLLLFVTGVNATSTKQASEYIGGWLNEPLDSAYGIERKPDSAHIFSVWDDGATAAFSTRSTTFPFSAIGIDTVKHFGDSLYFFTDQIQDIDGTAQLGLLNITINLWYDDIKTTTRFSVQVISDSLENMLDASKDSSSSAAVLSQEAVDSLKNQDDWGAKEVTLAYFDTLIYLGFLGKGVWIDESAGNTNTSIPNGDGTEKNPVSTFAAARTIADNLGVKRYYITNRSTFTGINDLTVTHEDWEFVGVGTGNLLELDVAGVDVDGSFFLHLVMSGTQGGTDDVTMANCLIGDYSGANGYFHDCGLMDTIRIAASDDLFLDKCYSTVAGNGTPGIGFGAGISYLSMRHYSGGIEIHDMDGNDKASIETDGQVIVNADCTAPNITVRGMATLTDNDGATTWTRDAVYSRQDVLSELLPHYIDSTWNEDSTSHYTSPQMAFVASQTSASAGISDADMASIADTLLNKVNTGATFNIASSVGRQIRELANVGVIRVNTAQAGGTNVITLDAGASSTDGAYDPAGIYITGGTGVGQTRLILEYDGTSKVAVVDRSWKVIPDATSEFTLFPDGGRNHVNEGMAQAGGANTITLNALASSNNDEYVGQLVVIRSGVGEDQVNEVTAYNGTSKVATVRNTWNTNPTDSSGYVMMPFAATPSIDEIWEYDTTNISGAQAIGTMLKDTSVYQGSASGLTKEDVADAVADTLEAGTRDIAYNSLTIDNQNANDTALIIRSNGTAPGLFASGGVSGDGVEFVGGATSGRGFLTHAIASNSHGFQSIGFGTGNGAQFTSGSGTTGNGVGMTSVATNGNGLVLVGNGAGNALDLSTGSGLGVNITDGYSLVGGATIAGGMAITEGLVVSNTGGDAAQFTSTNSGSDGLQLQGNVAGVGLNVLGGVGGHGANFQGGGAGSGIFSFGGASGHGMELQGAGSNGYGLKVVGKGDSAGFYVESGLGTSVSAVRFISMSTNGSGLNLLATGTGHGLLSQADQSGGTGEGAKFIGGGTSGRGIYALAGTVGDGVLFQGQGGQHGLSAIGHGGGSDIALSGDGFIASANDTVMMRSDSSLTQGLTSTAIFNIWEEILNTHTGTPGSVADVLLDTLDALISSAGGVASISDADMAAIIDTFFTRVASDTVSGAVYSYIVKNVGGGGGGVSASAVWDEVGPGGVVEDSSGNSTTMVQTNLSEATDNRFIGGLVVFLNGTEESDYRRITDYDGTNGYIVFAPALTGIPASGDSLRIVPFGDISFTGNALYTYNVVAIDTSGTDSLVSGVKITVRNTLTTDSWTIGTDGNGVSTHSVDSMSYDVLGSKSNYIFTTYRDTVTGNETDTIFGYNSGVVITAPSDTALCSVNGVVYDNMNVAQKYAILTFTLPGQVYNSCGNVMMINHTQTVETSSTGTFTIDLMKNSCMASPDQDTVYYQITIDGKEGETNPYKFYIPADSSTYNLVF